mgnify:CR=1 FL=1|jgi:hypothetical protein
MMVRNYYSDNRYIVYWDEKSINILDIKNKSGFT